MAISPQKPRYSTKIKKDKELDFPVLSDEGNEVAERFGLSYAFDEDLKEVYEGFGASLPRFNGDDSWTLPMPARYVVRPDGKIAHADIHPDYTQRPEPSKTLEQVKAL